MAQKFTLFSADMHKNQMGGHFVSQRLLRGEKYMLFTLSLPIRECERNCSFVWYKLKPVIGKQEHRAVAV